MHKKAAMLEDRGVISVSGADAAGFLQGLLTNDVERLAPGEARYAALLTPQGKILFDMIVVRAPGEEPSYLIDCAAAQAADLARRLGFYKLRAKVVDRRRERQSRRRRLLGRRAAERRRRPCLRRPARSAPGLARDPAAPGRGRGRVGARGRIRGPAHRRRSAQGRPRFRLWRRLPARRQFRSPARGRFRQGLLCRPGGRLAHEASRNGAQAGRAGQAGRPCARARDARPRPRASRSARSAPPRDAKRWRLLRLDRAEEAKAAGRTLSAGGVGLALAE